MLSKEIVKVSFFISLSAVASDFDDDAKKRRDVLTPSSNARAAAISEEYSHVPPSVAACRLTGELYRMTFPQLYSKTTPTILYASPDQQQLSHTTLATSDNTETILNASEVFTSSSTLEEPN